MGHPGGKGHLHSQHSQIQPDLLEGHKLPSVLVLGLIHHPIGAFSNLPYFLNTCMSAELPRKQVQPGAFMPLTHHPCCPVPTPRNTLPSPCPGSPAPGLSCLHLVLVNLAQDQGCPLPSPALPGPRPLVQCLATECRRTQTSAKLWPQPSQVRVLGVEAFPEGLPMTDREQRVEVRGQEGL